MKLTKTQKLMLFSLGHYHNALNHELEKVLSLHTPKITFIELCLQSNLFNKKERALYLNLETLEQKKLLSYDQGKVFLTETGLNEFKRIDQEIALYSKTKSYFSVKKPLRKLQTMLVR